MRFGSNVVSNIMLASLRAMLKKEDDMREGTDFSIAEILVDKTAMPLSNFVRDLDKFGLTVKPPESLGRAAALGLWLDKDWVGNLVFKRRNEIP